MRRSHPLLLVLAVAAFAFPMAAASASASIVPPPGQPPEVGVTPPVTRVGGTVRANLNGWAVPLVQVSICGDGGRRGSQDCDQVGSVGVSIGPTGEGSGLLRVRPLAGCPCVIRATTPDNSLVRTAPIVVEGAPRSAPSPTVAVDAGVGPIRSSTTAASAPSRRAGTSPLVWAIGLAGVLGGAGLALLAARHRNAVVASRNPVGEHEMNSSSVEGAGPDRMATVSRSESQEHTR